MQRSITILFRRDPSRDRQGQGVHFRGFRMLWPDGRPAGVGLDAFCRQGQRLLGLDRCLGDCHDRLIELICFSIPNPDDNITRLPGHRVRRFFLQRSGSRGRLHFLDGTATDTVFDLGRDEARVLDWIGLPSLEDGGGRWIDLAARPVPAVDRGPPGAPPAPAS
jgi:hypothetical protein